MTPCDFALFRYKTLALWRNLWSILLYSFGVVVVTFGIVAILFFLRSDWLTGAVNAAGAIASGVGIAGSSPGEPKRCEKNGKRPTGYTSIASTRRQTRHEVQRWICHRPDNHMKQSNVNSTPSSANSI